MATAPRSFFMNNLISAGATNLFHCRAETPIDHSNFTNAFLTALTFEFYIAFMDHEVIVIL